MVKSELLTAVAEQFPDMPQQETEKVVAQIFETMIEALSSGTRIEVRGFGSLSLRYRAPRTNARNPKNGNIVATVGKYRPHFRPGLKLRNKANASLSHTQIQRQSATSAHGKLEEVA